MDRFQILLNAVDSAIAEGKMTDLQIAKVCKCAEMFVVRQRRFLRILEACRVAVPVSTPVFIDVSHAHQLYLFPE